MAPRQHWTILIVPPGTGVTRTIHIGPRGRRTIIWGLGTAALLVVSAITILFSPFATPGARILAAQNARLQAQLDQIGTRLATLSDTLTSLGARDQQIRLLAGLPTDPTSSATALANEPAAADSTFASVPAPKTQGVKSFAGLASGGS